MTAVRGFVIGVTKVFLRVPSPLKDIAAEVVVLDDRGDLLADVLGVDDDDLFRAGFGFALDDREGRSGWLRWLAGFCGG